MTEPEVQVVDDAAAAAQVVAERLAQAADAGGDVVLTGGSTPRMAYERAAVLAPDWSRVSVWWGDERCVPPDDERSNYRMAAAALLDRLARPPRVHRIRGELGKDEAAAEYEGELGGTVPDLLLLGVGPDGHVASLFPGAPALEEEERRVVGAEAQLEPFVDRVTMTLPALRSAREILFLVTGSAKADAVRRAFAESPDRSTPASLVRAEHGPTRVVLDREAAAGLDT